MASTRAFVALGAVAIVGVLLFVTMSPAGVEIPDANTPTNSAGDVADGFALIAVVISFDTNPSYPEQLFPFLDKVWVNETRGTSGRPATITLKAATAAGTVCTGHIEMQATGPMLDVLSASTPELTFAPGDQRVTFQFGRVFLYEGGEYELKFYTYVEGCLGYGSRTQIKAFGEVFTFDGISESFTSGGPI